MDIKDYYRFEYEDPDTGKLVLFKIPTDSTLDQLIEDFKSFCMAVTYSSELVERIQLVDTEEDLN